VVGDQRFVYGLEGSELDTDAAGRGYVTHDAFGVEGMFAAYFYAYMRAYGKFAYGGEHAAYAEIAGTVGDTVEAIAIAYRYGTIFFGAVKKALCGTFHDSLLGGQCGGRGRVQYAEQATSIVYAGCSGSQSGVRDVER